MRTVFQLDDRTTGDALNVSADDGGRLHFRVSIDGLPPVAIVVVQREDLERLADALLVEAARPRTCTPRTPRRVEA